MKKVLFLILLLSFVSCKKEKEYCWQVYDMLGNSIGIVCGKTESEIQAQFGPYYDRSDASAFCWKIQYNNGSIIYPENLTEKMVSLWFSNNTTSIEKAPCGYCQKWMTREKSILKSTGSIKYSQTLVEQYCGDTCATIYPGRLILLRETIDSTIYHEFMQKLQ